MRAVEVTQPLSYYTAVKRELAFATGRRSALPLYLSDLLDPLTIESMEVFKLVFT